MHTYVPNIRYKITYFILFFLEYFEYLLKMKNVCIRHPIYGAEFVENLKRTRPNATFLDDENLPPTKKKKEKKSKKKKE